MPTGFAVENLREAFDRARELDGSMSERLNAFAEATRRLNPSSTAIVDRLVNRLREHNAGEDAPKAGDEMPPFVLPDENGRLIGLKDLLAKDPRSSRSIAATGVRIAASASNLGKGATADRGARRTNGGDRA